MAKKQAQAAKKRKRKPGGRARPRATPERGDEVMALAAGIAEFLEPDGQSCNQGTAAELAAESVGVEEHLLALSDVAQGALEDWPDAEGTGELRTLLLEVVEAAEADARRWQALAGRFEALTRSGAHLHVVEGELVAVVDDDDVIDAVPTESLGG